MNNKISVMKDLTLLISRRSLSSLASLSRVQNVTFEADRKHQFGDTQKQKLYSRLSSLGAKKGMVSATINEYIKEGTTPTKPELSSCATELRKYGKYQVALETLEWMETSGFNKSLRDVALHVELVSKVKGVQEAELYFKGLSDRVRNQWTYAALLNCYCRNLMEDQALALFKEMGDKKLVFTSVPYVNLMSLYVKLGQPEIVPALVVHMKKRNIELTTYTYCIWMTSCSRLGDVEGVEKVLEEVKRDNPKKCGWTIFSNLAATYVKAGHKEKAELALKKVERMMGPQDRKAYHLLLNLYAGVSNLSEVHRVWNSMKQNFAVLANMSYLVMVQALSILDDVIGLKDCYEEWASRCNFYDSRIPHSVVKVYLSHHMVEEAQAVFHHAKERSSGHPFCISETFMTYHLENNQGLQALDCMKVAVSQVKNNEWHLKVDIIKEFQRYFEEIGYVDYGEEFCKLLKKVNSLNHASYKSLLRTYIVAGKEAPNMVERIKEDGILIDTDLKHLLHKVCPE